MSCPACYTGAAHKGSPTGKVTKLHDFDVYIADPASGNSPKGIVVILPDCYGWEFVNLRLMADTMAREKDYRVYLPDFMEGKAAPLWMLESTAGTQRNASLQDILWQPYHRFWCWLGLKRFLGPNRFELSFPRVKTFLERLRHKEAAHLPVGVAGYCWGGKHVILMARNYLIEEKPLIDAGFACHPSAVEFWKDIDNIRVPISFAIPEMDEPFPLDKATETKKRVEAYPEHYRGELKIYEGYSHGFGSRADPINDDVKGPEEAVKQALAWFEQHFTKVSY